MGNFLWEIGQFFIPSSAHTAFHDTFFWNRNKKCSFICCKRCKPKLIIFFPLRYLTWPNNGKAKAQLIRLHPKSCGLRFKSQAHHLCFYLIKICTRDIYHCIEKRTFVFSTVDRTCFSKKWANPGLFLFISFFSHSNSNDKNTIWTI